MNLIRTIKTECKESLNSLIFDLKTGKNIKIKGNWIVGVSYTIISMIVLISIWVWVTQNDGHIIVNDQSKSTVNLKVKEGFSTNYTADDFNTDYVKPYEYDNYNGQSDSIDYTFEYRNEIGIMTNMVITANQTQKLCPENPNYYGAECNPTSNKCIGGTLSAHGTRTGKCVEADFPFWDQSDQKWRNASACQISGWCPVERVFRPLKNSRAVLLPTINATLRIQSTVYFSDYAIISNSLNYSILTPDYLITCRYDPDSDPLCPTFALKDIKFTPNAGMSYEQMAKSGGVIVITVDWKCHIKGWIHKNYDSLYDCKPQYSFVRTDKYSEADQTTYRFPRYFNNGKMRTHYRSWQIRLVVDSKITIQEFSFYRFLTSMFAYNGAFHIVSCIFMIIITKIYRNKKWDEEIDVSEQDDVENVNHEPNSSGYDNAHPDNQQLFDVPEDDHESDAENSEENKPLLMKILSS